MKKRIRIYKNISDMHDQTYRIKFLFRKFTSHLFIPKTFLLIGFIPLMYLLAGCGKNDNTQLPPTIRLLNEPGSISSDTTVSLSALLTFTIAAEGTSTRVTNLIIEVTSDAISQTYLDTSMNTPGFTINKSFVKGLANKEIWTFIIRDKNRLTNSTSIDICRDTATGFGPVRYIQNLMLSAQNNSDPGSFYSFESESVYTLQEAFEVQELIDLVYYFGEDSHTMGSPGANIENGIFEGDLQSWNIRRTTRFIELNIPPEVFEVSTNDSLLIASYMEGSGKRKAKLLAPGMIFSFKTENLKYGIFRVIEVTGTDNGTVKIDVKVQD